MRRSDLFLPAVGRIQGMPITGYSSSRIPLAPTGSMVDAE